MYIFTHPWFCVTSQKQRHLTINFQVTAQEGASATVSTRCKDNCGVDSDKLNGVVDASRSFTTG